MDYESKRKHSVRVKAVNRYTDDRFLKEGPFEDITIVQISVVDADEPPVFTLESYVMEIAEGVVSGSLVGTVSARDLDNDDSSVRYLTQNLHISNIVFPKAPKAICVPYFGSCLQFIMLSL